MSKTAEIDDKNEKEEKSDLKPVSLFSIIYWMEVVSWKPMNQERNHYVSPAKSLLLCFLCVTLQEEKTFYDQGLGQDKVDPTLFSETDRLQIVRGYQTYEPRDEETKKAFVVRACWNQLVVTCYLRFSFVIVIVGSIGQTHS